MDRHDSSEMCGFGHAAEGVSRQIDEIAGELADLRRELDQRIDGLAERLRALGASLVDASSNPPQQEPPGVGTAEAWNDRVRVAESELQPAVAREIVSEHVARDDEIDWQALEAEGVLSSAESSGSVLLPGAFSSAPGGPDNQLLGLTDDELAEIAGSSPGPDARVPSPAELSESDPAATASGEAAGTPAVLTADGDLDLDAILRQEFAAYPAPTSQADREARDGRLQQSAETPPVVSPVDDGGDDFFARPSE